MKSLRIVAGLLVAALIFGSTCLIARAEPATVQPSDLDSRVARKVCDIMERGHITKLHIDDEISRRIHHEYLKLFDPMKMYFLKSDIAQFEPYETVHDDRTKQGDLSFAFLVYHRFIQRLATRAEWAQQLADEPFDFTKEETVVVEPDAAEYAADDVEAKSRWRAWIKYEILRMIVGGETEAKARERIKKTHRNRLRQWSQFTGDEVRELYLTSLTTSCDPHSTYMLPRSLDDFFISIRLSLEGIGALLSSEDGFTVIKDIVPGGAADKDGRLKAGDKIVGVGQGNGGEIVDIVDQRLRDVVKQIRGKAGSVVRLEVVPADSEKRVIYDLTRQKIELHDREAKEQIIELPAQGNAPGLKVGVIRLPSFYADTQKTGLGMRKLRTATSDVRRFLEDFKQKGVDGVVIDLRANGGGLLNEAIDLTGLFIDEGPVVQVREPGNRVTPYLDEDPGAVYTGPLIVLVSRFSASASEIFAGAIKDYGRGIVVGDSATHGKGTVQKIYDIRPDPFSRDGKMGGVKLTMQMFYRVNGYSTQNHGVRSDIVLPSVTDHDDFGEAKLDYAMPFHQIAAARYRPAGVLSEELIGQLRKLSEHRCQTDPELLKLAERKRTFDRRRARTKLTFTEELLRREDKELREEDQPDKKTEDSTNKKEEEEFGTDAYTKEVLAIMSDYIRLQGARYTAR